MILQLRTLSPCVGAQVARLAEVAQEAAGLRLAFPRLASMEAAGTTLRLGFLNLSAELSFSAELHLGKPVTLLFLVTFPALYV